MHVHSSIYGPKFVSNISIQAEAVINNFSFLCMYLFFVFQAATHAGSQIILSVHVLSEVLISCRQKRILYSPFLSKLQLGLPQMKA